MGMPGVAVQRGRFARLVRWPLAHLRGVGRGMARCVPRALEDLFVDRCPQYAASIAYHVLFSLFPLTIMLVSIFGLVLQDDELRQKVIDQLLDVLPVTESGEADVQSSIEGIATPLSAIGLVSLVALLWGASGMMASIRVGLETAFKVKHGRPAAHAKLMDFLLVAAAGLRVRVVAASGPSGTADPRPGRSFLQGPVRRTGPRGRRPHLSRAIGEEQFASHSAVVVQASIAPGRVTAQMTQIASPISSSDQNG